MIEFQDEPDTDIGALEAERSESADSQARADRLARLDALVAEQSGQNEPSISDQIKNADPFSVVGITKSVGKAAINAPGNVIGGGISAVAESFKAVSDLLNDGNRMLIDMGVPGIMFDGENGVSAITDPAQLEAVPNIAKGIENKGEQLPVIGEEDSAIRTISKFFTGFAAGGKMLKGTKLAAKLAEGGFAGQSAMAAIKGAVSDFAFMDEMSNPANVLVESFPQLEGPITEFFDADPEDTNTEKRLKNALTGIGMGAAVDGAAAVLGATRGIVRARMGLNQIDDTLTKATEKIKVKNSIHREEFNRLLGDVDGPMIEIKPSVRSVKGTVMDGVAVNPVEDPGEVFINWSRIDTDEDVKSMIQQLADHDSADIAMSQRGVRSHIDTEQAAAQLNAWDTLVSRRHGEALNAEQSVAARKLWASSGRKVLELSDAASDKSASAVTQLAFRKQLALHSQIQRQVLGARTETARALNSWRIPAGDDFSFFSQMEALTSELERGVPTHRLAENIQTLNEMGNMAGADTFIYGAGRIGALTRNAEKASAMIRQLWYFSLLSRATTHVRNLVGNSSRLAMEVMDRRVAASIGDIFGNQNVPVGEAASLIYGQTQGAKEAFRIASESRHALRVAGKLLAKRDVSGAIDAVKTEAEGFGTFWKSAATGESGFGVGKVDARASGAFSPETLGLDPSSNWGRVFNVIDVTTSLPGRALAAGDEIFKTMSFNGERHALAFRRATEELNIGKISRDAFDGRVAEIVNDPDETIKLLMRDASERNTFTNNPGNGAIWDVVKKVNRVPIIGRLAMPFQRTPYNIVNEGLRRSPMGILMPGFWRDLAEGGAKSDIAWSKLLTGNAILLGMADLALQGKITGERPRISRESGRRALERRLDINSMTFRIDMGDGKTLQIPYRGFEPATFPMGLAANLVEIMDSNAFEDPNKETENLLVASSAALAMQMTSANYMRGVSELFAFMAEPNRYGQNYFEGISRSMSPGAISQFVSGQDPYIREVNGFADAFTAQIPIASRRLAPKRNAWGEKIKRNANGVLGSILPYTTRESDKQAIDKEMANLEYYPQKPKRTVGFPITDAEGDQNASVRVNLDRYPGAYSRWLELSGHAMKHPEDVDPPDGVRMVRPPRGYLPEGRGLLGELNAIVSGEHGDSAYYDELGGGPDGGKAAYIQAVTNYYRRTARFELLNEFPEIGAEVESRRDEAGRKFAFDEEHN